jgi:fido (protein-threonine AMPylation protein)
MVWMNHPFMDGNTRTTANFLILYLRSMGFDVDITLFETEALYFRGALVRACYQNGRAGVRPTREYLDLFLSKLLEDPEARLDHDSLWCREMFRHPDLIRNADPGAARVMQERLREEGVTKRVLGLGH